MDENEYLAALPELTSASFADSSTRTNPRMPLVEEIADLLRAGYYGWPTGVAPYRTGPQPETGGVRGAHLGDVAGPGAQADRSLRAARRSGMAGGWPGP